MQPDVSIIVRAVDAEKYLENALSSILSQTYRGSKEIVVVVDECPKSEKAIKIAFDFKNNHEDSETHFKIIKHSQHLAPFRAIQLGLRYAEGEFVGFLDYDNVYKKDFLEKNLKELEKGVDITFTFFTPVNDKLEPVDISKSIQLKILKALVKEAPSKLEVKKLLFLNYVDMSSLMLNSNSKDLIIKKFENLKHRYFDWVFEDWLIALVLAKEGLKSKRVLETTYLYRIHDQNTAFNFGQTKDVIKALMNYEREIKTLKAFQYLYKESMSFSENLILKAVLALKSWKLFRL